MKPFAVILFCFAALISAEADPLDSVSLQVVKGRGYVLHRVDKGQGLLNIAMRYKVTLGSIRAANPRPLQFRTGDVIRIPVTLPDSGRSVLFQSVPMDSKTQRPQGRRDSDTVIRRNGTVDEAHANADSKEGGPTTLHTVVQGETLYRISQRYKVTIDELTKWNGIRDGRIDIGQVLIVDAAAVRKPYECWNLPAAVTTPGTTLPTDNVVEQWGVAVIAEGNEVLHQDAPAGTLLLVTDLDSGAQCYAQVTSNFDPPAGIVAQLPASLKQVLPGGSRFHRITIRYSSVP